MSKTYADICLERAAKAIFTRSLINTAISADDVPELSCRLKRACEALRKEAHDYDEPVRYLLDLVDELEAIPKE